MDGVMGCEAHARCAQGRKWQGCGLCSATAWVGLEWGQGSVFGFFFVGLGTWGQRVDFTRGGWESRVTRVERI